MLTLTEEKCPKCGGSLCWTEWSGRVGARTKARCENHVAETKYDMTSAECDFECMAVRKSDEVIIFEYYPVRIEQLDLF